MNNRERERISMTPEFKAKAVKINHSLDTRRNYIQQREDLKNSQKRNINGFLDRETTNNISSLTRRITELTKHINQQRQELF